MFASKIQWNLSVRLRSPTERATGDRLKGCPEFVQRLSKSFLSDITDPVPFLRTLTKFSCWQILYYQWFIIAICCQLTLIVDLMARERSSNGYRAETDKRVAPPIPCVYWFGLQNLRHHMCCRAIIPKLLRVAVIAYHCHNEMMSPILSEAL